MYSTCMRKSIYNFVYVQTLYYYTSINKPAKSRYIQIRLIRFRFTNDLAGTRSLVSMKILRISRNHANVYLIL